MASVMTQVLPNIRTESITHLYNFTPARYAVTVLQCLQNYSTAQGREGGADEF